MIDRIPLAPFETFALGRYEGRLHEALENGVIKQDQLKELTTEETVRDYIESQRSALEREFAVLLGVDEIYKREQLTIDESEVESLIEGQREEFKKAGKIATVRSLPCMHACFKHDLLSCPY
jgi:FKBP-type peptidyl-prolyl cis-trans isomerase (trigger factor)